jgi:hypothetical protein
MTISDHDLLLCAYQVLFGPLFETQVLEYTQVRDCERMEEIDTASLPQVAGSARLMYTTADQDGEI